MSNELSGLALREAIATPPMTKRDQLALALRKRHDYAAAAYLEGNDGTK